MGWRLRIRHVTALTYAGTVHASYNEARLSPMTLPRQTTLFNQVEVQPSATTWRYYDYWATLVTSFDLQRAHHQLTVTSSSLVETEQQEAVADQALGWDDLRDVRVRDPHVELLAQTSRTRVDEELQALVADEVRGQPPARAAVTIAEWVRANVSYVPGSTGVQTSAQDAWNLRNGVCQDIAHLTVGLLRSAGLPTRYVSGYLHPRAEAEAGETVAGQSHAWVEFWCGDWYGYDPTNGVPAGLRHVVVARGRDYDDVAPLKGVYHGPPTSQLGVTVEVTRLA
jgi:transglutaminase-like putative cysteine protease